MSKTGRNDPCPCGSGKKYKKCCALSEVSESPAAGKVAAVHALDQELVTQLLRFARSKHGAGWLDDVAAVYYDGPSDPNAKGAELPLLASWGLYQYREEDDEPSVAEDFLGERRRRLSDEARAWLAAQLQAWLSVWEVLAVEPGKSVSVRDLLTHEERVVHEVSGSEMLALRDTVLARVVDYGGSAFFCGMHPRALPPMVADAAVKAIRKGFRVRTAAITPLRLRPIDTQLALISLWHASVAELDRPRPLPKLCNTDGDPLLLTKDHFDFKSDDRSQVVAKLQRVPDAQEAEEGDEGGTEVRFTKTGNPKTAGLETTLIGLARVGDSRLVLETNSLRRADDLRQRLEAGLVGLVKHRLRDHSDVEALLKDREKNPRPTRAEDSGGTPPELRGFLREIKEKHMAGWLDEQIPALGGLTPREAAQKRGARAQLDLLLRDMENQESRSPADERYDFNRAREALGLREG